MTHYTLIESPVDTIMLSGDDAALTGLHMSDARHAPPPDPTWNRTDDLPLFKATAEQLDEYFSGDRKEFDLPLELEGTAFQKEVWRALREIPYGQTASYGEIAARVGRPGASRAVGLANGRNPIGIIVPCHRVIGANGTLTGYGGGLDRKQWLLALEGSWTG
ncbi:MAG TPA: methylated-DNA--[protein]-cysteine S-methyltransferase [Acidimicrobiales bacterium]|nr:methylated-DNA--[protein]-cysteine S-methyltransferase [Acidimicrobiales bacterium]